MLAVSCSLVTYVLLCVVPKNRALWHSDHSLLHLQFPHVSLFFVGVHIKQDSVDVGTCV